MKIGKQIESKKDINSNPSNKREKIKRKIMKKYGLSGDQAEKILRQYEDKHKISINNSNGGNYTIKQNDDLTKQDIYNQNTNYESDNEDTNIKEVSFDEQPTQYHNDSKHNLQSNHDVDEIIGDIIPDYNKKISIELKNVNLTFDLDAEQVDTLKEQVIMKIKGKKTEKKELHVLKDINLKIYQGEKVGIIGFNGAGKSTLLKVICGIYPPDEGEVFAAGNISPFLSLGLGFDSRYTGRKNIFLNGAVLGYDKKFLEKKEQEIIEFSELGEFIDVPIKNYSSGMRAKLGFAIATMVEPDILVIDEVLGVGDAKFRKKSKDKMKSLMDGNTTVLLVSHAIGEIRSICTKAIWIDQGEVKEIGEVNKVCDHYTKAAENATYEQLRNLELN